MTKHKCAVRRAINRMVVENLKADIRVLDAANTGYEDEFFDGIIDSAMIYANTSTGIDAILKELNRILKRGGKLFSTGLFKQSMYVFGTGTRIDENTYKEIYEGPLADLGTVHFFNEEEIYSFWSKAGFSSINVDCLKRTEYGGKITIEYYMVEAIK